MTSQPRQGEQSGSGQSKAPASTVKVVLYKPSLYEEMVALLVSVLAGLAFLSAVSKTGNINNAINAIVQIVMVAILAYITILLVREILIRPILSSIAKLKIEQVRLIVKKTCDKELSDHEIIELLNTTAIELAKKRTKETGKQ